MVVVAQKDASCVMGEARQAAAVSAASAVAAQPYNYLNCPVQIA
nr:hypothetical protein XACS582_7080002 [Xanthomonas citri pv. citri]CEL45106.1 hypothetical protein XAC439_6250002 [Xanthomonas citri pv. citri]